MYQDVALPLVILASITVVFSAIYAHWVVGRIRERRRAKKKSKDWC